VRYVLGFGMVASTIVGGACNGSIYSYRDVYLDLDPTYKDRFGRPFIGGLPCSLTVIRTGIEL
jgi:hypothetical protein